MRRLGLGRRGEREKIIDLGIQRRSWRKRKSAVTKIRDQYTMSEMNVGGKQKA